MRFSLFVGLRYIKSRKRQTGVAIIALITILGVSLGVMCAIVVLSVLTGFDQQLRANIIGNRSHIVIEKTAMGSEPKGMTDWESLVQEVESLPHVEGASPVVAGMASAAAA